MIALGWLFGGIGAFAVYMVLLGMVDALTDWWRWRKQFADLADRIKAGKA